MNCDSKDFVRALAMCDMRVTPLGSSVAIDRNIARRRLAAREAATSDIGPGPLPVAPFISQPADFRANSAH